MDVNHLPPDPQFNVLRVLHRRDNYTVGWLEYGRQRYHVMAERWDGEGPTDVGYPVGRGGRPKWMIVAEHLWESRLPALLGEQGTDDEAVRWAIRDMKARTPRVFDRFGNNAVVQCPACDVPFLVTTFPKPSRECPHCKDVTAFAEYSEETGITVRLELKAEKQGE